MNSNQSNEESIMPLLFISSIKKQKKYTLTQTQRYDKQQKIPYLRKSHTSSLTLMQKINYTKRKISESNLSSLKINKTFDFIASNLIPCTLQTKNKEKIFNLLQKIPQIKQKSEVRAEKLRKISQKRKQKAKLLNQLITNYKLQKSISKPKLKQQHCYFATEISEIKQQKKGIADRQQTKGQIELIKRKGKEVMNSFPFDPDLKMAVQHELSKLWRLKSKSNAKINQFNLVNYFQRSNYQNKLKNIKITLKKQL